MGDKKEYIERGALLNILHAIYEECRLNDDGATSDLVWDVIRHIEDQSLADVVEVRHGEWIRKDGFLVCSECDATKPYAILNDTINYWRCDYCNGCGAKMDGERREQT